MADERKNADEEYQYADINLAEEVKQEPISQEKVARAGRRFDMKTVAKRLAIPIVVIVAIYAVYQFINPTLREKEVGFVEQTNSNVAATADAGKTAQQPAMQSSATVSQDFAASLAKTDIAIENEINQLKTRQAQDATRLQALTSELQGLSGKMAMVQTRLGTIQSGVEAINAQLKQQKKPAVSSPLKKTPVAPTLRISYTLKALVPGRAWLEASNGQTVTVKIGDSIIGYGKVTAINPTQGWVATSSGKHIEYGADDA